MTTCLAHRGPDATGSFVEEGVSLGHNRLSIIDLSATANQPMHDAEGELVIVFNGEIYNFQELKKELQGEYSFKTKSDTEVILAGYRKWGKGVAERLNGMFAFAIWDKRDGTLFCARDHAGMKPFYYFWDGTKFIFASELQALLTHPIPRTLNKEALNHYFRVLYTPEPMTLLNQVYKLPPSHTLLLKGGAMLVEPYSQTMPPASTLSYGEAVSALRGKVLQAVERHLVSDVPVGVYLSGGIDSSTVLFAMSQFRKNIQTFTIGFDLGEGEESEKFNSDFELAKKTAEHFGTEHHYLRLSASDALSVFEEAAAHNSDPISNPTFIAMFALARFAKQKVSVSLTGNAGDELFGGYDRYRTALAAHYYKKLPRFVRAICNLHPRLAKLDYAHQVDLFAQVMFQKDHKLARVIAPSALLPAGEVKEFYRKKFFSAPAADLAEALMHADQRSWLPDHFFMLSDKMSMASALEERMPLADKEVSAFARSLPRRYKVDLFNTKKVLKDAFRNDLPSFLFNQPKRGWFSPAAKWLRHPEFAAFARGVLSEDYYNGTKGLFNWPEVAEMLEKHINKEEYNLTLLWAILTFQIWARQHRVTV
jgi:asparagine synthase (glutamine-hydrolysing)